MSCMETNLQIKYCLYARKSSEQDERQAMSIDSQLKEMMAMAERDGLDVVETKQESYSAKQSGNRPVFNELLADLRNGKYNGILTWAPDRLSRNAGDLGSLVDLMDGGKLERIRTFGQSFSNTPNEKFLLMILCSQAKLENDNRGVNVKRGIRAKCETGWRPCMPPLGYFTRGATGSGKDVIVDEKRAPYIRQMFEMSAEGKSGRHIKQWLLDNGVTTRTGKTIPLGMVYKILKNSFYYGKFEYPNGSGKWYQGKHEPIINKGLYDKVQAALIVPLKSKWGAKQFPYKQFLKCYSCGSSIVGEEKLKKRTDGTTSRFVYYHCSRQVKYDCEELFARESDIANSLVEICEILSLQGAEPGLKQAINRFALMTGNAHNELTSDRLHSNYIKYVVQDGTEFEKTRLVRNLNTNLALHNRQVVIAP